MSVNHTFSTVSALFPRNDSFCLRAGKIASKILDGEYRSGGFLTRAIAHLLRYSVTPQIDEFHDRSMNFLRELRSILEQGTVSQVVIHGENRIPVFVKTVLSGILPSDLPIIMTENKFGPRELLSNRLSAGLTQDIINKLPDFLDCLSNNEDWVDMKDRIRGLYVRNRLIRPYQVDTEKFPFTDSCI